MRALKLVVYAVLGLVALLVIGVVIVAATFDPNAYRPQIVGMVKQKTGRDLAIGDIGLKFFPKLGAQLKQVSLAQRSGTGEFAGVDNAQVYVALLPLLSREVVVDEVRIDGLRANLEKHADGTTNFDDLLQPRPAEEKPAPTPPAQGGRPVRFDINGIHVTNARLTWKDATNGNDVAVDLTELSTGRIREQQPVDLHLAAAVRGAQPKLALQTRLDGTLDFDLAAQRFHVAGLRLQLGGDALDFSGIDVTAAGDIESLPQKLAVSRLQVKGKAARGSDRYNLTLDAPTVESTPQALLVEGLALAADGTVAGMQLNSAELKVPSVRLNPAENRLLVDRLTLAVRGSKDGDQIAVDASVPRLDLTPDNASGESARLALKLDGPQRKGDVALALSGVQGSGKAFRIAAVTLTVDARQQDSSIKGELSTPVQGNLEGKVFELPKLAGQFAVSSPALPKKTAQVPVSGSVLADVGKEHVAANLVTRFDESNIKAKAALNGFAKPGYEFDVAIDRLNLDQYRSPPAQQEQKPAAQAEPEKPIDLSALKPLDLKGSLRIGQLQASNVKASNVRVDVRAKDGRLTVDPLAANLYQGSMNGTLSVDANTNRFAIRQNLSGVSIGPLLRDAADKDILEGRGTVVLDLTTQGNLVSALKQALAGTASLALRDGAVKGVDLAGAVRRVKAAFGAGDVEGAGGAKQQTDFSELTASFAIRDGIAHNEDLTLKSPFLRVTGAGDVNIPQSSLDYVVKTSVVASMAGQGGSELAELKGLTVPVHLTGPFDQIKYKVDVKQMVRGASREQLEAAAKAGREALKGNAKEKLQELLGGKQPAPAQSESGEAAQHAAPKNSKEQLKDTLKGLLR